MTRLFIPYSARSWFDDFPRRECDPTYRLEEHISSLRDTDPERWATLNAEWLSGDNPDAWDGVEEPRILVSKERNGG